MNILHVMGTFRDNNTLTRITSVTLRGEDKEREESQNVFGKKKEKESGLKKRRNCIRERGTNRGKSSKKRARGERKKWNSNIIESRKLEGAKGGQKGQETRQNKDLRWRKETEISPRLSLNGKKIRAGKTETLGGDTEINETKEQTEEASPSESESRRKGGEELVRATSWKIKKREES